MKYFTYVLLVKMNGERLSEAQLEQAELQWKENSDLYKAVFSSLSARLPDNVYTPSDFLP